MNFRKHRELIINSILVVLTSVLFLTASYIVPLITWSVPISQPFNRSAIISFSSDDGGLAELNTAVIMRECGYRMTFYIVSSFVGLPYYLDYDQLLQLQSQGFEIGSHSTTHAKLTTLSLANATKEIVDSKALLESHGLRIHCFAFPYGLHNITLDTVADQTYDYVRYNYTGLNENAYRAIDCSISNKTWLNFNFHSVNAWGYILYDNHTLELNLRNVLSYLAQRNIPVLTQIQAYYLNEIEV
jgi:peptidoglycan/xylan/chitin deacetylase (PgdA/CDA1 family)